MSKEEMSCPHHDKISQCNKCMAELGAMSNLPNEEPPLYKWVSSSEDLLTIKSALDLSNLSTFSKEGIFHAIKAYGDTRELEGRIDELSTIPLQHGNHTTIRYLQQGMMQSIGDRYAELNALKDKTHE